jgi:hypothetical protein
MCTQPEPSILGFHHRRLEESGVYIVGFGTHRIFSLALAAARRLLRVDEFLPRRQSIFCRFNLWFVLFTKSLTMKVVAAYLLALLGGNESPSAKDLKHILGSGLSFSHFACCFFFFFWVLFSCLQRTSKSVCIFAL